MNRLLRSNNRWEMVRRPLSIIPHFLVPALAFLFSFQLQAQTVTLTTVNPSCSGYTNGSIAAVVTGGTAPYSFAWSNGSPASGIYGLGGGTYSVTVTDAAANKVSASATVTAPAPVSVGAPTFSAICTGAGTETVSASGGTGAFTFNWGSASGSTVTLAPGGYNVTATDSKGCAASRFVSVPSPVSLSIKTVGLKCFGDCDASVEAIISGGTAPFTFKWSNGATTQLNAPVIAGTYSVTVTDANGCLQSATATITNPTLITLTTTVTNAACGGASNGTANVSVSGGVAPYSYKWSSGQTTATATNLAAGSYTVSVLDANGCLKAATVTITNAANFTIATSATNATCGSANGSVSVKVTGGTGPFTYKWSNNATTSTVSNVGAGTYNVTVTDANGCTQTGSVVVNASGNLSISVTVLNNASCGVSNGMIMVNILAGTAPFTYKWSDAETTAGIKGLAPGIYTVTVSDASGCTAIASATITQTSSFTVQVQTTNISCNGGANGTAIIMVQGGSAPYTYKWSNGATTASVNNFTAGTYTITVTDANGCTAVQTITIGQPAPMVVTLTPSSATCGATNGSVVSLVSGGTGPYAYKYSNGSTGANLTGVATGSYTLTVTDANNCTQTATVTVTGTGGPNVTANATNAFCNGNTTGSITLTVTGGTGPYAYKFSNGATTSTVSNLAAGPYSATVTDASGCTTTVSATVTQPTAIAITLTSTNASCGQTNGALTATVTGGTAPYTYKWSNGSTSSTLTGLVGGTYSVTVTDANGCTATGSSTVTNSASTIVIMTGAIANATCNGTATGSATVSVSGGTAPYKYLYSNGATTATATGLLAGTYTVTVTDASGCSAVSAPIIITQPTAITVTFTIVNAGCNPTGSVTATVTGGTGPYKFLYSTGATTSAITSLAGGTYVLTVTDANNCTATQTAVVTATPSSLVCNVLVLFQPSAAGSADGALQVVAALGTAPYTYKWSNGATSTTLNGLTAGTYTVTVTDAIGCNSICSATLIASLCNNVTNPGVIAGDQTFCPQTTAVTGITSVQDASGGTGILEYLWMFSTSNPVFNDNDYQAVPNSNSPSLTAAQVGNITQVTYFARCARRAGCPKFIESNVVVKRPQVLLPQSFPFDLCAGRAYVFEAPENVAGASYGWNFGTGATPSTSTARKVSVTFSAVGNYSVTFTTFNNGCIGTKTVNISVNNLGCLVGGGVQGFAAFTTQVMANKNVKVDWATAKENGQSTYFVQRSADGKTFMDIQEAPSVGGVNNTYHYMDESAKRGRAFYRIKNVALNGDISYSQTLQTMILNQDGQPMIVYPNPVSKSLFVEALDVDNADGLIEVLDASGRAVVSKTFSKDESRYEIPFNTLPSGIYLVKMRQSDGVVHSMKVLKVE